VSRWDVDYLARANDRFGELIPGRGLVLVWVVGWCVMFCG